MPVRNLLILRLSKDVRLEWQPFARAPVLR
jgi:hypothetical protein